MLDVYYQLEAERIEAEKLRDEAFDDVKRTEENMTATINASWKQGSDTDGRNYYYNFVTGESRWDVPENWKMNIVDQWIRNMDERANVYYYNQQTGETRWLPPCVICGFDSERFCGDCGTAYCEKDYDVMHSGPNAAQGMSSHMWALTEYAKERLDPGQVYCVECKRHAAKKMCTTCWDAYCEECCISVHHTGALRLHKFIPYKKAKKGWICVKGGSTGDPDYYVNGTSGETSYEKPTSLMTEQELVYYNNFKTHKDAADKHVKKIDELQFSLEAATYERDTVKFDALMQLAAPKEKKPKTVLNKMNPTKAGGLFGGLLGGITKEYASRILQPTTRERGKTHSDYIQQLLDENK